MGTRELTDEAFANELVRMFGFKRAVYLMGWCTLLVAHGVNDRRGILDAKIGGLSTRYKVVADLDRFREHLLREGYAVGPQAETEGPAGLVARAAAGA